MRLAVLNHYFDQDLDSLRYAAPEHVLTPYTPWHSFGKLAAEIFPEKVFDGIRNYWLPELEEYRLRFRAAAQHRVMQLYAESPFDVFITPSDTFFYVYDAIHYLKACGIPVVVIQKETSMTEAQRKEFPKEIAAYAPVICDAMCVTGKKQADFWLDTGCDPNLIIYTGQPRFDFYRQPERWPLKRQVCPEAESTRLIFYLSYQNDACIDDLTTTIPRDILRPAGLPTDWKHLKAETEEALGQASLATGAVVAIKPHPQQADFPEEMERIKATFARLGARPPIFVPASAETRHWLVVSDIVVGFQTTALLEAILLGRPTIFSGWGPVFEVSKDHLLPYHHYPDCFTLVHSQQEMAAAASQDPARETEQQRTARTALFEQEVGPCDGQSSRRCWDVLEQTLQNYQGRRSDRRAFHQLARNYGWRQSVDACYRRWLAASAQAALYPLTGRLPLARLSARAEASCRHHSQRFQQFADGILATSHLD